MGVRHLRVTQEGLAPREVRELLVALMGERGEALVLVPSLAEALACQRELEAEGSLALGVSVSTPATWLAERWSLYGDGRVPVSAQQRLVLMARVMDALPSVEPLAPGQGSVCALAQVAEPGLAWLPQANVPTLSAGELRALEILRAYAARLQAHGLVEPCELARELPRALAETQMRMPPVVFAGFGAGVPRQVRELACELSAHTEVWVCDHAPTYAEPEPARSQELTELLRSVCIASSGASAWGATCSDMPTLSEADACGTGEAHACGAGEPDARVASSAPSPQAAEAAPVAASAGVASATPVTRTGAVRLLEPAGPVAEAELVCREVTQLVREGARSVVVCVPNVASSWGQLAPKLATRGVSVRGQLSVPVLHTRAGSAFVRFARSVAELSELAASWPAPLYSVEGKVPQLGDMGWWPPNDLVDYLLSDISGVSAEDAWARDTSWRGNRILTPAGVLATLQNRSLTSPETARACAHLLKGHFGAAAGELLRALEERVQVAEAASCGDALAAGAAGAAEGTAVGAAPTAGGAESVASAAPAASDAPAPETAALIALDEARAALGAAVSAAEALRELGLARVGTQARRGKRPDAVSLTELEELLELALGAASVSLRPRVEVPDATCEVTIATPAAASRMAPLSVDALIYLGLDAATSSVGNADNALCALLEALGIERAQDRLAAAREQFAALVRLPRAHLVLERSAHTADAEPTYPAVLLGEVLDAYGRTGKGKHILVAEPERRLDEAPAANNLRATGTAPEATRELAPAAPAGKLADSLRRFVVVPRDGQAELPDGRPSLSASQVETYLECPYKWFSLRRLGLDTMDAGFGGMEMGTFAHRVLELTHRELLRRALVARGYADLPPLDAAEPWDGTLPAGLDPRERIARSAVTPETLAEATQILHEVFASHLRHQYMEARRRSAQALIPHNEGERLRLRELERDLVRALEFEATRLEGFEPRFFELRFGGRDGAPVSYAGADLVGTIDRVDVDGHGRAFVIDYKHKARIFGEYALRGTDAPEEFVLPRHVQTLMYARILPQIADAEGMRVAGALYFGTRGEPCLTGAVEENAVERLYEGAPSRSSERLTVPAPGVGSFEELLDRTEERVAAAIQDMLAGRIDACPADKEACTWCPVLNCERRMRS